MSKTISAKTAASQKWPSLRVDEWTASRDTLHTPVGRETVNTNAIEGNGE